MAFLKRYRTGRAFLAAGACVLSLLLTLDAACKCRTRLTR